MAVLRPPAHWSPEYRPRRLSEDEFEVVLSTVDESSVSATYQPRHVDGPLPERWLGIDFFESEGEEEEEGGGEGEGDDAVAPLAARGAPAGSSAGAGRRVNCVAQNAGRDGGAHVHSSKASFRCGCFARLYFPL